MGTVDRQRWVRERSRFLRERLTVAATDGERAAIETELALLREERRRPGGFVRRLLGMPRDL
jgi:hypothetical protein